MIHSLNPFTKKVDTAWCVYIPLILGCFLLLQFKQGKSLGDAKLTLIVDPTWCFWKLKLGREPPDIVTASWSAISLWLQLLTARLGEVLDWSAGQQHRADFSYGSTSTTGTYNPGDNLHYSLLKSCIHSITCVIGLYLHYTFNYRFYRAFSYDRHV